MAASLTENCLFFARFGVDGSAETQYDTNGNKL